MKTHFLFLSPSHSARVFNKVKSRSAHMKTHRVQEAEQLSNSKQQSSTLVVAVATTAASAAAAAAATSSAATAMATATS